MYPCGPDRCLFGCGSKPESAFFLEPNILNEDIQKMLNVSRQTSHDFDLKVSSPTNYKKIPEKPINVDLVCNNYTRECFALMQLLKKINKSHT